VPEPARPTLRLLRELSSSGEWGKAHERTAATTAAPSSQLPPFHELDHPLIRHAATICPGRVEVDAQRESISSIQDQVMWKLRHARWRAAVYEDSTGQAWICAAGIRAEGDQVDFYTSFPETVKRRGLGEFLPTDEDRRRLRLEEAEANLSRWEQELHEKTRDALAVAAEVGTYHFAAPGLKPTDPSLGHVRVEVETISYDDDEPDEQLTTVAVTVKRIDWARADLAERADIVILAAIEPREQAWDITSTSDGAIYSFDCSAEELAACLCEEGIDRQPGKTIAGQVRHWTHKGRLTQSVVLGNPVEGLCGTWFVPRQDADKFDTCPQCDAIHRQLPT
jgi:hypothetical protein